MTRSAFERAYGAVMNENRSASGYREGSDRSRPRSFATDVMTLVGGTTIAQVISVATSPLITRLYDPDAYGTSSLIVSIATIIAVIACLRYEYSIMLPKTDWEASNLLASCLLINLAISLIIVPIMYFFGGQISFWLNAPYIEPYLWIVPPLVFSLGAFSAINYWNSRKKEFSRLSSAQVASAFTASGTKLGLGFAGYASGGSLIGAQFLANIISTSALGGMVWKKDKKLLRSSVRWREMKIGLHRYRDFPLFDTWSALLNSLTLQMPLMILSIFFSSTVVGFYSLGLGMLVMPLTFVGSTIGQVFYQRAAEAKNESPDRLASVVEGTTRRLIILGVPAILLITIIGEEIFSFIFGANWAEAGIYAQILSIFILVSFVISPISGLFSVLNKIRAMLYLNLVLFLVRSGLLIAGGMYQDVYLSLVLFSGSSAVLYSLLGGWILNESGVSLSRLLRSVLRWLLIALPSLVAVAIVKYALSPDPVLITFFGAACLMPYYIVLFRRDEVMGSLVRGILHRGSDQ